MFIVSNILLRLTVFPIIFLTTSFTHFSLKFFATKLSPTMLWLGVPLGPLLFLEAGVVDELPNKCGPSHIVCSHLAPPVKNSHKVSLASAIPVQALFFLRSRLSHPGPERRMGFAPHSLAGGPWPWGWPPAHLRILFAGPCSYEKLHLVAPSAPGKFALVLSYFLFCLILFFFVLRGAFSIFWYMIKVWRRKSNPQHIPGALTY